MSYFERSLPIALIFGSFFAIFVPLLALQLAFGGAPWLQYLTVAQAVGLGTTLFFITLAVYFQSQNLAYFNSSARNRVVYFAVPVTVLRDPLPSVHVVFISTGTATFNVSS